MQRLLVQSNSDLLDQSRLLVSLIDAARPPRLLAPYTRRIRELCVQMAADAQRNLDDLHHNLPSTFEAVLSNTQVVASYLDRIGANFIGPILRGRADDEVMLALLRWLHSTHPETAAQPFAFGDGMFAVYHVEAFPTLYWLPASRQYALLYVPLFFHEFGHVLYRFHKPEMDDLVREFQRAVAAHATPTTIRERRGWSADYDFRNRLVLAWYPWTQEFFCDAVGLTIGGATYLKAFSHYLRLRSSDQYYRSRRDQLDSRHPVTVLRTRLLADRARSMGLGPLADAVESEWAACARLMKVREDFEGTWSDELLVPLRRTLTDMLEEAAPVRWSATGGPQDTPVRLAEEAWASFERSADRYASWEADAVRRLRTAIGTGKVFGIQL